jgi:hypothetical protein
MASFRYRRKAPDKPRLYSGAFGFVWNLCEPPRRQGRQGNLGSIRSRCGTATAFGGEQWIR